MTEQEYDALCRTATEFPWNKDDGYDGYCMIFQKRLAMCGLALVPVQPDPLGFFIQGPIPPPNHEAPLNEWGNPPSLTPADDPWAWPVPSWIVFAETTPVATEETSANESS